MQSPTLIYTPDVLKREQWVLTMEQLLQQFSSVDKEPDETGKWSKQRVDDWIDGDDL